MSKRRDLLRDCLVTASRVLEASKQVPHPEFHLQVVCKELIEGLSLLLLTVQEIKEMEGDL